MTRTITGRITAPVVLAILLIAAGPLAARPASAAPVQLSEAQLANEAAGRGNGAFKKATTINVVFAPNIAISNNFSFAFGILGGQATAYSSSTQLQLNTISLSNSSGKWWK